MHYNPTKRVKLKAQKSSFETVKAKTQPKQVGVTDNISKTETSIFKKILHKK